ncbi:hypothetical protein BT93_E0633 [Corymbia citriodora subsp. variegata]|nr:hypothetical protein BT93_E0633 [Corymbia citriodora subsp. variegata]
MRAANSSVDTVNAAAAAIVTAEARAQPASVQKRRWGSCWSLYLCFGYHRNSKRIGHAVLVPEPAVPSVEVPAAENHPPSTAIVLPFIAPPSSPTSVLQSDPPSVSQSPVGLVSLAALAVSHSPSGPSSIFSVGPYAYETQLVSPPVFSTFTTEPSTASFTPPPESLQVTTPSSPEVPFAQLLTSSLERARRNSGPKQKFSLSQCEFQPYQIYPGSPGGKFVSPGSTVSNSGTSSPFPGKYPVFGFRIGEAPKLLGFEHFNTRKWGSRLGSGSLTPDGAALGSRLGSGALTPDGAGLSSGLGSGCLTPNGVGPPSQDGDILLDKQMSVEDGSVHEEPVVHHRISFELTSEDVARCLESKSATSISLEYSQEAVARSTTEGGRIQMDAENSCEKCIGEGADGKAEKAPGEMGRGFCQKHCLNKLGSVKEFNFDNSDRNLHEHSAISSEWWANDNIAVKEAKPESTWSFLPFLQPEVG